MTNQQILQKATEKAVEGGLWEGSVKEFEEVGGDYDEPYVVVYIDVGLGKYKELSVETFIFSHDFAKAFWGDDDWICECRTKMGYNCCQDSRPIWQHHLQQMVLEEDPIKYLATFL